MTSQSHLQHAAEPFLVFKSYASQYSAKSTFVGAEISNEEVAEQLAAYMAQHAFIDFAAVMRRGDRHEAACLLLGLEDRFACTLFQFWLRSPLGRSRPDLIAVTALRLRGLIRGESEIEPHCAHSA